MSSSGRDGPDASRLPATPPQSTTMGPVDLQGDVHLLVLASERFATHPLPPSGDVLIGRSPQCDIHIDDGSVSRTHARLRVGREITIEDLGSANGTRCRDAVVEPGRPIPFRMGEPVQVGGVTLVLQRRVSARPRRVWGQGYFEGRVEEECGRAERSKTEFAVAFVRGEDRQHAAALEELLTARARPSDVLGSYGPCEYEVLVVDATPAEAEAVVRDLEEALAARDLPARLGLACYPRDSRDPDTLLSTAAARARGRTQGEIPLPMVVEDPAMHELYRLAETVARSEISLILLGETGTGKEVLAEWIHQRSPRAARPFLRLNCAALAETLLESELFGHERGAFTGAVQAKPGLLETADGGTVFLDEIGELPLPLQAKLLRVLEDRKVLRVGGLEARPIDVRFVAATNRDLEQEVVRGAFRGDLFFRLNGFSLVIPPLRERPLDVEALARAFLERFAAQAGQRRAPALSTQALEVLRGYSWPGNVRELRNAMERAVLLCGGVEVRPKHLPLEKMTRSIAAGSAPRTPPDGERLDPAQLREMISEAERKRIVDALAQCAGNQTRAAQALGMNRRTLVKKLERYGIARPRKRT